MRLRSHHVGAFAMLFLAGMLGMSGCSSPTGPTRPGGGTPDAALALTITCPPSTTASSLAGAPVAVTFTAPVANGGRAPVQVTCTHQSGSLFPLGSTTVTCTATDALAATASCSFTVGVNPVPRLSRTKFLAFGDSLTAGEVTNPAMSTSSDETPNFTLIVVSSSSYPTQLTALLRARYSAQTAAIVVENAGLPGERAENAAKRLPSVMATTRPEVLLLLSGVNELRALGDAGVPVAWQAIDTMAKEARSRGARVFLATLPPPRPGGRNSTPLPQILTLNDRIRTTAAGEGAVLVDLYSALATDITRFIGLDGLHPTEAGYQRIAETFAAAVRANLEVR
jgi:lysophospholipase L1-like esterase